MKKLLTMAGGAAVALGAALPAHADYAVTSASTGAATSFALFTSAETTPTYRYADGALASPFLITYKEGETVSVTSPNGATTQLTGSGGTINYTPTSGGLWTFENSNGLKAYVGVGWAVDYSDAFSPVTSASASLAWLETVRTGPDRKIYTDDTTPLAYSDGNFAGFDDGTITITTLSPSSDETVYTRASGEDAKTIRLREAGIWTVTLTTSAGTSTAQIQVSPNGLIIIFS